MLRQRVLTALVLAPCVLGSIYFLPTTTVAIILGLIILIGAWEWVSLSGLDSVQIKVAYISLMTTLMIVSYPLINSSSISVFLAVACLWWFFCLFVIITSQLRGELPSQKKILFLFVGLLILIPSWMSLLYLHGHPSLGPEWALFLLVLIWTADIGAYFAGRAFGRRKLADKISPGKSWEGVIGGLVAVLIMSFLLLPYLITTEEILTTLILLCLVTVMFSVLGDLAESVVKRIAGKKDSGNILPGHGGVMDRIDSLTAAAPIFTAGLILSTYVPVL
ncbi:MAG: phosphatidate cytidylyltransferase [Gammaproteobacteria bacterium]